MKLVFPSVIPIMSWDQSSGWWWGGGWREPLAVTSKTVRHKWTARLYRFADFEMERCHWKVTRWDVGPTRTDLIWLAVGSLDEKIWPALLVPLDWAAPAPVSDVRPVSPGESRQGKQPGLVCTDEASLSDTQWKERTPLFYFTGSINASMKHTAHSHYMSL